MAPVDTSESDEAARLYLTNRHRERSRQAILSRQTVLDGHGRRNGEPLQSNPEAFYGQLQFERKPKRDRRRGAKTERQRLIEQILDAGLHREFAGALIIDCRKQTHGDGNDTLQLRVAGFLIDQFRKRPERSPPPEPVSAEDLNDIEDLDEEEVIRRGNNKVLADKLNVDVKEIEKCNKRFDRTVVRVAKEVLSQHDRGTSS